ncbi:MAG: 1-acyl-sn-glycerol-3-phosphate acyltransferase, partial [Elusimicrobiota bacterium]
NLLYAVIVPDTEYFHKTQEINVSGKIRWELENYSKRIAPYKRIMGFIISKKDLPRTRLKKIKRYEVEYRYGKEITPEYQKELLSEEDYKLLETTVAEKIIDHLSRTLKRKVNLNDHLEIDLGIDSLGRVELAVALESLLKIEIPDSILISVFTVKELIVEINNIAKKEITDESKDVSINWGNILKQKPRDEVTKKIELYPGTINRMLTILVKNSFLLLLKLFWSLKIENKNNVPVDRPIILCPNHSSFLDGFIVMCSVPYRCAQKLFFFGHRDYFDKSLIAWCVKIARIISIAPSLHLVDAMQSASFVLNAGKSLCIFPEGELSIDGSIKTFKKGIGILSRELNITLVPVLIQGSFFAWARGMQFPKFSRIRIIFGKPVTPDELLTNPGGSAEDDYQTIASNLRERIIELTR